jgi:hypothetical protein
MNLTVLAAVADAASATPIAMMAVFIVKMRSGSYFELLQVGPNFSKSEEEVRLVLVQLVLSRPLTLTLTFPFLVNNQASLEARSSRTIAFTSGNLMAAL